MGVGCAEGVGFVGAGDAMPAYISPAMVGAASTAIRVKETTARCRLLMLVFSVGVLGWLNNRGRAAFVGGAK